MHNHVVERIFGPSLKLQRAAQFFQELEIIFEVYGKEVKESWQEIAGDPNNVELRFSTRPPVIIPLIIGDIVHNLRSSLDLAVNLVVSKFDPALNIDTARLEFPFAETENEHRRLIKKKFSKISVTFQEYLIASQAFKGGNAFLYGLHQLDILDKHRYIMPVIAATRGKSVNQLFQEEFPQIKMAFVSLSEDGESIFSRPSINREGFVVSKTEAEKISFERLRSGLPPIGIFPADTPFAHQHVMPVLNELIRTTDDVLCDIAEKFLF